MAQYFGPIPKPQRELPATYTLDPVQDGERSVTLRRVGGTPLIYRRLPRAARRAPRLRRRRAAGAGAGRHARRAACTSAWSRSSSRPAPSASRRRWPTRACCSSAPQLAPGQDVDAARSGAAGDARVAWPREPITAEELERARTQWLNGWEQGFTDPETVGVALSEAIAQGDWRLFFLRRDRVRDADAGRRAARRRRAPAAATTARSASTCRPSSRSVRRRRRASTWRALVKDFKPQAARGAGRGLRRDAGQPRRAHAALRAAGGLKVALLPKGTRGQAVQARADAALRRRGEPARPGRRWPTFVGGAARQGRRRR